MKGTVPLRFACEELAVLQRVLGIEKLPGLKADLLDGVSREQQVSMLVVADETLRARNLIGWRNQEERALDPNLEMLLRDYAQPKYILFVDTLIDYKRGMRFLYVWGQAGVYEQCEPEPGVVQLRMIESEYALWQRLTPRVKLAQLVKLDGERGQIGQRALNEGLKVVRQDIEKAQGIFAESLPTELAEGLALAYQQAGVVQYLAGWQAEPTVEQAQPVVALTILLGHGLLYLLWVEQPEKGEDSQVSVVPGTPQMVEEYVRKILPLARVR